MAAAEKQSLLDLVAGCLVGGAIGDGMGSAVEGRAKVTTEDLQSEWRLTDDTQLTLATCEAIRQGGLSAEAVASSFVRWFDERRLSGLGASTLKALRELSAGAHWALSGRKGEMGAGNGVAMRVAPLAFLVDLDDLDHRRAFRDICRITHHNDEAYAGALAVVAAIQVGLRDRQARLALDLVCEELPDTLIRDRLLELHAIADTASAADVAQRFGTSGYVVESVPLALFAGAKLTATNFDRLLQELVLAGGDTDTNASIFGQVAGARLGLSDLPEALARRVPGVGEIVAEARLFAKTVEAAHGS